jgi:hypothetical protein
LLLDMVSMKCVAAVSALCLGVWATPCAFATTVTAEQGQVLLNTGQGYRLVQGSTNVNAGDMIVVNPGGMARITYDDGCVTEVRPPAGTAISSQSPCQQQKQGSSQDAPQGEPQAGIGGISTTHVLLGTALVGGGLAAWYLLSHKGKPASP